MQASPSQQPVEQDVVSHTQAPARHRCPWAHPGPEPHRQAPSTEQLSANLGSQAAHADPPEAQVSKESVWQVGPEQQPPGHETASQPQAPFTQRWSPAQAWQARPPVPQASSAEPARQAPPEQQPEVHESPSQTHAPPTQRLPDPQGVPVPHAQAPFAHESARSASQAMQATPPMPQADAVGAVQTLPAQQPAAQSPHPWGATRVTVTCTS